MAEQLSLEQQEFFRQSFNEFDLDGDGRINTAELKQVFEKTGLDKSEEEVQNMINEVDTNKNGSIEFDEFLSMIANKFGSLKN